MLERKELWVIAILLTIACVSGLIYLPYPFKCAALAMLGPLSVCAIGLKDRLHKQ